jgi:hypothetical protein
MATNSNQPAPYSRTITWLLAILVILLIVMAVFLYSSLQEAVTLASQRRVQTSTATATEAFLFTSTPLVTDTPQPTPTITPPPCNLAAVTQLAIIPNDGALAPGEVFTSTWRLDNLGSCEWNRDYALTFVNGNPMDGPEKVTVDDVVDVGEAITLTMTFTSPSAVGDYQANYAFTTDVGETLVGNLPIAIRVTQATGIIFDGATDPCGLFTWAAANGLMACPSDDATQGSVVISDTAILVRPNNGADAVIRGATISFVVQNGDHFQATLGCPPTNTVCDAVFTLGYLAADGSEVVLNAWPVSSNGLLDVDVDLSSIAGNETALVLTVHPSGEVPQGNYFAWVQPRIVRTE